MVEAYLTNPELEAARARLQQTDEFLPQARAGYRPSVFVDTGIEASRGEAGVQNESTSRLTGGDDDISLDRTTKSLSLTARQNLYAGGGTAALVSRAENLVRAERARLLAQEQSVLLDVVGAYSAAWRDQSVLDLALNNEQRLTRQLDATRDRFEVGEVARTDVAQAEARLSRARADVETAKADLASSRATFERVIGQEPQNLSEPMTLKDLPGSISNALALAATNPDIVAATYDLYAARDQVDVSFAELLPSLDLQGQVAYEDQPTSTQPWARDATVGLVLSIPLYQGGAEYSRVRENRQQVREQRDQLENQNRRSRELASSSWERLLAATAAIDAFRSEVRANRIALEGVQQEALVGSRTVLDVLDAEQELFTSEVNLVRARREEIVASYQLKLAVGELTAADLRLDVVPYDPEAYYNRTRNRLFGVAAPG